MIIRGTTPTIEISTDASLVDCVEIYVTLKQGKNYKTAKPVLERTKDTFDTLTAEGLTFTLTQEETLALKEEEGVTFWQIRAKYPNEKAVACDIGSIKIAPILKEGVI